MAKRKARRAKPNITDVIVISDTHCGCQMGLCPPLVSLDGGGTYQPSDVQKTVWGWWEEFWAEWVPRVTEGRPYCVVHNGDAIDGSHHKATTQITQDLEDQGNIAYEILVPVVAACEGRYYHIRGTEAHVGQSGVEEERLAKRLGAIPNPTGQHARWDMWMSLKNPTGHSARINFGHHIGTTGSMAYETSALMKELSEMYAHAARWGTRPPDVVVRSHRHRCTEVRVPTQNRFGTVIVTPAWQLKTPFAYRIPGGRVSEPQIGGIYIHCSTSETYTRHFVKSLEPSTEVRP